MGDFIDFFQWVLLGAIVAGLVMVGLSSRENDKLNTRRERRKKAPKLAKH